MMYLFSAGVSLVLAVYGLLSSIFKLDFTYLSFILFFAASAVFCFKKFQTRDEYGNNLNTTKFLLGFLFLSLTLNEVFVWLRHGDPDLYLALITFIIGVFFVNNGIKISQQLAALKIRAAKSPKNSKKQN